MSISFFDFFMNKLNRSSQVIDIKVLIKKTLHFCGRYILKEYQPFSAIFSANII